tara:strand:+ start:11369 stop:12133 length:765 start_codon:yes stop_codon:yes gene_type:complete
MELNLQGKRALITGATKGIGLSTAHCLAQEGCDLILVARDKDALQKAAEAIASKWRVKIAIIAADLSTMSGVEAIQEQCGPVDILVNNAGAVPPGDLMSLSDAEWRDAWDLKPFGYIALTRALYPVIRESCGVIVNVIGSAGESPSATYVAGSTGNAALMMFTRSIAKSARQDGFRVVGINPGPVATERFDMLMKAEAERRFGDSERWPELTSTLPYGRAAQSEEIAAAIAFLASPLSAYTNGAILTIDGGGIS